jgi:hypothetical protein
MEGTKMQCPKCQFENPVGVNFCVECGNKLEKICPECGYSSSLSHKFCGGCGHKLRLPKETPQKDLSFDEKLNKIQKYLPKGLTEKILSQKDRIEGERKQVTVMFCDMQGFTPLSELLGIVRGDLKLYFIRRFENVVLIVCIFFPKLYFLL